MNGAVFLGLNGVVVKSHGGTDAPGFEQAISVAASMGESRFRDRGRREHQAAFREHGGNCACAAACQVIVVCR